MHQFFEVMQLWFLHINRSILGNLMFHQNALSMAACCQLLSCGTFLEFSGLAFSVRIIMTCRKVSLKLRSLNDSCVPHNYSATVLRMLVIILIMDFMFNLAVQESNNKGVLIVISWEASPGRFPITILFFFHITQEHHVFLAKLMSALGEGGCRAIPAKSHVWWSTD